MTGIQIIQSLKKFQKKTKIEGKYPFLQNHLLYETHQVSITTSNEMIPNFVGGSLPRCDTGDREVLLHHNVDFV